MHGPRTLLGWAAACAAVLAQTACSPGLESYSDITDLRVLGLQADPPEILANQAVSLDTNFTALVVDPRGGTLQYSWSLCPVQSTLSCDDFNTLIASNDAPTQALLRQLRAIGQSGSVDPTVADADAPSHYPIPPFNPRAAAMAQYGNDITPAVWAYQYQQSTLLNFGLGAWPMAVLTLTSAHNDSLVAVKRVVLGIQDYNAIAAAFAQATGVVPCGSAAAGPNCLNLAVKTPNSNPNWQGVSTSPGLLGNGVWTPVLNQIILDPNTQVRLRPLIAPNSRETYQTLRGTLGSGGLEVETITEMISVSWFQTGGKIENNLTQPLLQLNLENVYTSPELYSGKPVALWLVLRDQRGGESWRGVVVSAAP